MMDWAAPRNFQELLHRVFGLRPILLTLIVSAIFILELRFDWVEQVVGHYLVTTNSARPESGAIWEKGRQTLTAQKALEKIVAERLNSQRQVRSATSILQIAQNVSPGQGVMLSPDQFRRLYLKLSPAIARKLVSPFELLKLASQGHWLRTYFAKEGPGLAVYLLDADNHVLRQFEIAPGLLSDQAPEGKARSGSLDGLSSFKSRIYPADRFFEALATFPAELQRSMVPDPAALLAVGGRISRVGISDETVGGRIEIGFEIINGNRQQVILIRGQEWAVWRLRSKLESKDSAGQNWPGEDQLGGPR